MIRIKNEYNAVLSHSHWMSYLLSQHYHIPGDRPVGDPDENEDVEDGVSINRTVECEGGEISITTNLFDGLCELAKYDGQEIDTLCINQSDLEEKAYQVLLMSDIYSAAHQVVVWLSSDTTGLSDFVWLSRHMKPALQTEYV